jgi:hypothetical protein
MHNRFRNSKHAKSCDWLMLAFVGAGLVLDLLTPNSFDEAANLLLYYNDAQS